MIPFLWRWLWKCLDCEEVSRHIMFIILILNIRYLYDAPFASAFNLVHIVVWWLCGAKDMQLHCVCSWVLSVSHCAVDCETTISNHHMFRLTTKIIYLFQMHNSDKDLDRRRRWNIGPLIGRCTRCRCGRHYSINRGWWWNNPWNRINLCETVLFSKRWVQHMVFQDQVTIYFTLNWLIWTQSNYKLEWQWNHDVRWPQTMDINWISH